MTSTAETAQELEVFDRLVLTPEMARWLRDTLNQMDLEDDSIEPKLAAKTYVEGTGS